MNNNKLVSAKSMTRYFLGGRGVGRGGVGSVGYSFNWPRRVQAPLLSRQLRHVALENSVFQDNHGRLVRWMQGNSLRLNYWTLIIHLYWTKHFPGETFELLAKSPCYLGHWAHFILASYCYISFLFLINVTSVNIAKAILFVNSAEQ